MKLLEKIFTTIYNFIKKETAFSLILTNVILCSIYILTSDPFGFFQRTYLNADPFFPFKKTKSIGSKSVEKDTRRFLKKQGDLVCTSSGNRNKTRFRKNFFFLNTILRIKRFTKISPTTDPKKFGFNGEELKLEIQTESGEIGKLDIGISENGTFVKEPNTGEIWIVEENLNSLLGRGNENFFFSRFLLSENI
ncbi:PF14238 domain protein, partial [Leptospira interrogans serovar Pyrogenes str. 200701872]